MKTEHQKSAASQGSMSKSNRLLTSTGLTVALLLTGCQSTPMSQSNATTAKQMPVAAKTTLASALQQQRRQSFSYHSNLEINNDQQFANVETNAFVASDYIDEYCEDTHDHAYADLLATVQQQGKDIGSAAYADERATLKDNYLECTNAYQAWEDQQYDSDVTVPSSYQALFDHYDERTTPLAIKKSKLLDEYLLKPLSINAQGVYQPLAGKATMLASVQYQARNHHTSVNQPIYLDFKNGDVYLWADNFAMFNSELLDDKLGTKWRNKWLKIAIDDGTLPKGFGREVLKSHFAALDKTYEAAPVSQFDYVAPDTLSSLSPKLPAHQLSAMLTGDQIIRRVQSADSYHASYQSYMQLFYDRISKQYPELVTKTDTDNMTDTAVDKLTSKAMVQKILGMIKEQIDSDRQVDDETVTDADISTELQELYGFDNRGQLRWQHLRRALPSSSKGNPDGGMILDALQQYTAITARDQAYPNLPSDAQTPNANNSIDVREYSRELIQYYKEGNGTAIGKMMFSVMPLSEEQLGLID